MTTATRNGSFPKDARSAAELYLTKGLAPIPLPPSSKDPGYPGWQQLRLTPDVLDSHFPPSEARNVGILNGAPSGNALDVDLDCAEALLAAPRLLPATGWVFGRSGAPGSHRIYHADRPLDAAQEKYADLDGTALVELRGTGGLTVYPPSTHEDTGEPIAWERFTDPGEVTLADLQRRVREVAAVALLARHWPAKGTRQDAVLALVGGLLRAGWGQARTERFVGALAVSTRDEEPRKRIQAVAQTVGKLAGEKKATGWPRLTELLGEDGTAVVLAVRRWLGMAAKTSTKAGRTLGPYQPFPVESLPCPIDEYVRQGALALGCDAAYLALPALAVVASVIGNARAIRLKRGWEEPSVVWSAIVGDSGTLKSPAYLKAVAHLFRLQRQMLLSFKEERAKFQERVQEYLAAKKAAKADGTDPGDPPEAPVLRRVVVSDTTVEKLAEILEDNPRGTLVARDELAGWLGSFARYKSKGAGSDLPAWLEFFRAGSVLIDRKTTERKNVFIDRAAVSVCGGIQPGVLARALTPEFLDAGLAARLLMAMPPKLAKKWSEVEVALDVEQAYQGALDRLLTLDFDTRDGEKVPHVLTLSAAGKAAWVAFYDGWAKEQAAVEGELAAAFSKLEGYAARFALLHHVVTRAASGDDLAPVERESVEAGVALCRWFAAEARRIYATLSETTEERDTRRLVEFVQARGGRITVRELMRANCRRYPDAALAEAALADLVQAGQARWVEVPTGMKGGKRIKAVELCMTHDTDDTDPGGEDGDDSGPRDSGGDTDPEDPPAPASVTPVESGCDRTRPDPAGGVVGVMRHAEVDALVRDGCKSGERCHPGGTTSGNGVRRSGLVVMAPSYGRSAPPTYVLVADRSRLGMVVTALDGTALVALDLETTKPEEFRSRPCWCGRLYPNQSDPSPSPSTSTS